MKIAHYRKLNQHETYAVTRKQLKHALSTIQELEVLFGLARKFQFDSRQNKKPEIKGAILASISYSREKTILLSLFPIDKAEYPEEANNDFITSVLPYIKEWTERQIIKSDTEILGVEQLIVEWKNKKHYFHHLTLL